MIKFPLGALFNGEYCLPCNSEKGLDYLCPECKASVIIRKGDIKKHHFAHKPGERDCKFYDHPGEGAIHKMTKYIIADLLSKGKIKKIVRSCPSGCNFEEKLEYEEGDEVVVEYRVNDKCIVDVAVINNGTLKYVFEICDTHKTTRETPEPWFEIDAKKFLKDTENGTKLTKDVEYDLDIDSMNLLQIVEELHERGALLEGTLEKKRTRLRIERRNSEYVYCMRGGKCCPSCKIHMSEFTAGSYNGCRERIDCMKQEIINSKEYEECYPVIGAIESIIDHKGQLSVRVNGWKFEKSPRFIQRKFEDMLMREWSELDWGPIIIIRDARDVFFNSEWADVEDRERRKPEKRPGLRKSKIENLVEDFHYQCAISTN